MSFTKKPHQNFNRKSWRQKSILAVSGMLLVLAVPGAVVYGKQLSQLGTALTSIVLAKDVALPIYRFVPGQRFTYNIDYTNSSNSDLRVLFGDLNGSNRSEAVGTNAFVNAFATSIRGEQVVTILEQKGDRILISYSLHNPVVSLKANGQEVTAQAQLIQQDLKREIFATINSQGKILSVQFDPVISEIAQNFARTLLATMQFVTPSSQTDTSEWTTQEDDPNGQYIARYQADKGKFQKTKVRYLQPPAINKPNNSQLPTIINPEGILTADFDIRQGHLISLQGTESQKFFVAGKNVGQANTTLSINYTSNASLNSTELAVLQDAYTKREKVAPAIALSATPTDAEVEANIQRQELGDATLESLLADLEEAEASPDKNQNNTPLYLKFKALIYLHPEFSTALGKRLAAAEAKSLTMQLLAGALGTVGNAQAQSALVTVIQAHRHDSVRLSVLIPSLGSVNSPTEEAEYVLRSLAFKSQDQRITSTAQLALGTMARNLAQISDVRADKIVEQFVQKLQTADSDQQTQQILLVLGNAGVEKAFGAIARLTTASNPIIRATAFSALRWIQDSQVDTLLSKGLSFDQDDGVRLEAAVALGFREMNPTTFPYQKQAFLSDKAVKVRLAALKNLWQGHEKFPEVRLLVKQAAKNDVSKDVQEAAASIVKMYPQGYFDK